MSPTCPATVKEEQEHFLTRSRLRRAARPGRGRVPVAQLRLAGHFPGAPGRPRRSQRGAGVVLATKQSPKAPAGQHPAASPLFQFPAACRPEVPRHRNPQPAATGSGGRWGAAGRPLSGPETARR